MKTPLHILAFVFFCVAQVQADSEAILDFRCCLLGYDLGTVGWTFQAQTAISVTSLGSFASIVQGQGPISVGLWTSTGSLLGSVSVTTNSLLVNQSRYEPVPALSLSPGQTYFIVAFAPSGT